MRSLSLLCACGLLLWLVSWTRTEAATESRWWRGNTHTHTYWSDGDAAPEVVAEWYKASGYEFLVLSDHNGLSVGERWFPVSEDGSRRLSATELEGLIERFGPERIEVREREGRREMRLVTLPELRERYESPGEFLFIQGEEITSSWRKVEPKQDFPVHINALNLDGYIAPRGGQSVVDLINKVLADVGEHQKATGQEVLAHVNHPNFGWGITWQDLAAIRGERFFEVYNGHRGVRSDGDAEHPDTETMWDLANALRVTELGLPLLYGVATDDSHNYGGATTAMPGRGWVMVHAPELEANALLRAMKAGAFYASTGVELAEIAWDGRSARVAIAAQEGVSYRTEFLGVTRGEAQPRVFAETAENPAMYTVSGEELFVRARVTASRLHPNPFAEGDREQAWTQPRMVDAN